MYFSKNYDKLINSHVYKIKIGGVFNHGKSEICEKTAIHGNKLSITRSHISKRAPRTWKPNLRTVKADVDGEIKKIHVCAKCLKNGKVKRA